MDPAMRPLEPVKRKPTQWEMFQAKRAAKQPPLIADTPLRVSDPALVKLAGRKAKRWRLANVSDPGPVEDEEKVMDVPPPAKRKKKGGPPPMPPPKKKKRAVKIISRQRLRRRGERSQYEVKLSRSQPTLAAQDMTQIIRNDRLRKDPTLRFKLPGAKRKKIGRSIQLLSRKDSIFINVKKGVTRRSIGLLLKHLRAFVEKVVQCEFFAVKRDSKLALMNKQGLATIDFERFYGTMKKYLTSDNNEFLLEFETTDQLGGSLFTGRGEYLYDF